MGSTEGNMSMTRYIPIVEAPDGSSTDRSDMAELHKHNAEVRALISKRPRNVVVECPLLAWSEGHMGG